MKKTKAFILFALLSVGVLFSQPPQKSGTQRMTIEERAKSVTEWMTEELNLTAEQIVLVDSINLLFTKVQQSYFQSVDNRDKRRETMITLRKEKEDALSKVLTNEQLEDYITKVQEMMDNN